MTLLCRNNKVKSDVYYPQYSRISTISSLWTSDDIDQLEIYNIDTMHKMKNLYEFHFDSIDRTGFDESKKEAILYVYFWDFTTYEYMKAYIDELYERLSSQNIFLTISSLIMIEA